MPRKRKDPILDEPQGEGSITRNYYGKRNVQYSIAERIRYRVDPDLIIDFWTKILEGYTPIWVKNKKGEFSVEIDPSPLATTPSLEMRARAIQELNNRGWGLPVQSLQVEAHLKQTQTLALPGDVISSVTLKQLAMIRDALQLTSGDVQDAEIVETQEPCQEPEGKDAARELQEPCQPGGELQEPCQPGELQELGQQVVGHILKLGQESIPNFNCQCESQNECQCNKALLNENSAPDS